MGRFYLAVICLLLVACQPLLSPSPTASPLPGASQRPSQSLPSASGASSIPVGSPSPLVSDVPLPAPSMTPQPELVLPASALTVLAGSDVAGFQDGRGGIAKFNEPKGLAIDSQGNLYLADTNNHAIRKISMDGEVSTLAGMGQPGDVDGIRKMAQFRFPRHLSVDTEGQIFLIENTNSADLPAEERDYLRRIRKINSQGIVSTLHLEQLENLKTAFYSIFLHPDSKKIYITTLDSVFSFSLKEGFEVKKILEKKIFSLENSGLIEAARSPGLQGGAVLERFSNEPFLISLLLDKKGNMIIADANPQLIWKFTPEGKISSLSGGARFFQLGSFVDGCGAHAGFHSLFDLVEDKSGFIYASDHKLIRRVTPEGCSSTVKIQDLSESQANSKIQPLALALDQTQNILYFLSGNKVYKLDLNAR